MDYDTDYLCYYCPNHVTERFFADVIRVRDVDAPVLVFTRMASRFMSRKSHDIYVLADAAKNGPDAIIGYSCDCKNGLRTVGCCSHVATTIYYLGYARHNGGIMPVAGHVDRFFEQLFGEDDGESVEEEVEEVLEDSDD